MKEKKEKEESLWEYIKRQLGRYPGFHIGFR
jgi:hypothetical protein